jgi:hypothetical protein
MNALKKILVFASVLAMYSVPVFAEIGPEYGTMVDITLSDNTIDINTVDFKSDPVISSDGKWIAFKTGISIWIVPSEGGVAEHLYSGQAPYINSNQQYSMGALRFIPGDKEVAFMENTSIVETSGTTLTETSVVWTVKAVNIETKEVRVVLENANWVQFTRDGRYISYINYDPKTYTDISQASHNGVMTIYDTQTGEKRYLTNENIGKGTSKYHSPTISLDKKWVYFNEFETIDGKTVGQLYRMPFEGGAKEQLTFFENVQFGFCRNMNFSPDGRWILFDYCFDVLVYNTETGEVYRYFPGESTNSPIGYSLNTGWETSPSWMPDGTSFVYNLYGEGRTNNDGVTESTIFICRFDTAKYPMADVQTIAESENPAEFATINNYPNPFNPSTTIEFNLTKPGLTNLSVYNIAGQKVCELVSSDMTAGKHSVIWNGRNSKGTPVSSGIFFTRLETKDSVISNRMMLIK